MVKGWKYVGKDTEDTEKMTRQRFLAVRKKLIELHNIHPGHYDNSCYDNSYYDNGSVMHCK